MMLKDTPSDDAAGPSRRPAGVQLRARRSPKLIALGVLAVALGALGAAALFTSNNDRVLHHADLAVHHGGSGTLLATLTAGTPQLLLPKGADQFWNADAARAAGLVDVLEPGEATAARVAEAAAAAMAQLRPEAAAVRAELVLQPASIPAGHPA